MAIDLRPQRQATLDNRFVNDTWGFDRTETAMVFERIGNDQQPEKFGYGERDLTNAGSQKFAQAQLWDWGEHEAARHHRRQVEQQQRGLVWGRLLPARELPERPREQSRSCAGTRQTANTAELG